MSRSSDFSTDTRSFVLHVDADGRIRHVNDAWLSFGRENHLPQDRPVLGRELLAFIADTTTQQLYATLLERVRRVRQPMTFPFRCDSPALRRFMEMQMRPLADGAVEFRSRIVRSEPRPPVALLDPAVLRSEQLIRMCGWCKQVAIPDWVEVEVALLRMNWFQQSRLPGLTHGICPACDQRMTAEIGACQAL